MEELLVGDPYALGPYRLIARLTAAAGEQRFLAARPDGEGLAELVLPQGDPAALRRPLDAARAAAGPGLPRLLDDALDARPAWLAVPYVPSLTLEESARLGPLPQEFLRSVGAVLADALARLHDRGATHGGIARAGVLIAADGPRLAHPRPATDRVRLDDVAELLAVLRQAGAEGLPEEPLGARELAAALRAVSAHHAESALAAEEVWAPPGPVVAALARGADAALARGVDRPHPAERPAPPGNAPPGTAPPGTAPVVTSPRPGRRTLLTAGAGILLGGGAVAGWVAGRGGADALTAPAGAARTSRPPVPEGAPPAALWRYDAKDSQLTAHNPVLWNSRGEVVYLVEHPRMTALRMSDAAVLWQRDDVDTWDQLQAVGGRRFVYRKGLAFTAVSFEDGKQLWTSKYREFSDEMTFTGFLGHDAKKELLYFQEVANGPGEEKTTTLFLTAFDLRRRRRAWSFQVPTGPKASGFPIASDKGGLRVLGRKDGTPTLFTLDPATGRRSPDRPQPNLPTGFLTRMEPETGHIYSCGAHELHAYDMKSGRRLWRLDLVSKPSDRDGPVELSGVAALTPPGGGTVLATTDTARTVYLIDPKRGRELWRRRLPPETVEGAVPIAPRLDYNRGWRTLLATGRTTVTALDVRTGAVKWRFLTADQEESTYGTHAVGKYAVILHSSLVYALPVE